VKVKYFGEYDKKWYFSFSVFNESLSANRGKIGEDEVGRTYRIMREFINACDISVRNSEWQRRIEAL
jgi:hypothetical protein